MSDIKLLGMRELRNRINRLDQRMQKRIYNKAARAGGQIVVNYAKQIAPVRTRTIQRSLVQRASSKIAQGFFGVKVSVRPGRAASQRTARRRGVGREYKPDVVERYYRFQETGTKYHPAKPFLKPALQVNAGAILRAIRNELAAGLEREARAL